MKINLKESLNELDIISDNRYDLYNTYLAKNPSNDLKKKIAEAIYDNRSPKEILMIINEKWDDAAWHDTVDQEQVDQPDYIPDTIDEWEVMDHKSVRDSDGLITDYTWYKNTNTGEHVFVFGDSDLYGTEDGWYDWECDSDEEAEEWFDNYKGPGDEDDWIDESLDEALYNDIYHDFRVARENWKKLNLGIDFDSALDKWNKESKLADPKYHSKPIYNKKAWDDMVSMFSNKNESLKEDASKEWKPNLNFKHIKDVLEKALSRGKYINNEREEIKAALDLCDKKQKYTPEQRKFIQDSHREMWKKNRKIESLNESKNYKDLYFGEINFKLKNESDKQKAKQIMSSVFGDDELEGGKFSSFKKTKSGYILKYYGNIGSIYYEKYFKEFIKKMKNLGVQIQYKPELPSKYSKSTYIMSLDDEEKVKDFLSESLDEDMVKVEPTEKDLNKLVNVLTKYGFKLDNKFKPGRGLFGSYHVQVINPDLDYIDFDQLVKDVEPLGNALDNLSFDINLPITYNFGANDDNVITGGIDIHVGYKDDSDLTESITYPNGKEASNIDIHKALNYMYGEDRDMNDDSYTNEEKQKAVNYWIKKTDGMYEDLNEASYGGAFDIEDDMYFTKEELVEFAGDIAEEFSKLTGHMNCDVDNVYMENDPLALNVDIYDPEDGISHSAYTIIDMRKIRKPSDIYKYMDRILKQLEDSFHEYHEDDFEQAD